MEKVTLQRGAGAAGVNILSTAGCHTDTNNPLAFQRHLEKKKNMYFLKSLCRPILPFNIFGKGFDFS